MRLTNKINALVHPAMLAYVRRQYAKKIALVEHKHPELFANVDSKVVSAHLRLWSQLAHNPSDKWLRMFAQISSSQDYRFVPEDIYYGVVERCLNNCNAAGFGVEDKSDVCFYIPADNQPKVVIRYVRGVFFDGEMGPIPEDTAQKILDSYSGDVVGKPTMGSCGGARVVCFNVQKDGKKKWRQVELTTKWIVENFEAYVVQEKIVQEQSVSEFNSTSINTCRIMTFRRPWSGQVSVIAGMLRLGCSAAVVDNLAAGGVSVDIDAGGKLAGFAVDHDFGKVSQHPVSHKTFGDFVVPHYTTMCEVVCNIAKKVPGFNLLSFDVVAREDGTPCVIEINATSMTLAQLQTQRPLFGVETEQVVEWCKHHRAQFDSFNHFRTWL